MIRSTSEKSVVTDKMPGRTAGFTLVEMLVALAIIGILSAISIPFYRGYIDKARVTVAIRTMQTLRAALEDYHLNNGGYPPAIDIGTGGDGQGGVVLQPLLLDDFKKDLFSLESYTVTTADYILKARATDTNHTLITLTPGQLIKQGP